MTIKKAAIKRGFQWQEKFVKYLRERGFMAEQIVERGRADNEGDVFFYEGSDAYLGQLKSPGATGRLEFRAWLRSAEKQAEHFAAARGLDINNVIPFVAVEEVGSGEGEALVVMRLREFIG